MMVTGAVAGPFVMIGSTVRRGAAVAVSAHARMEAATMV